MKPPYQAKYWDSLSDCQKINDLVHKIAQFEKIPYPDAYKKAALIFDVKTEKGTYSKRIEKAGQTQKAIETLIKYHDGKTNNNFK